MKTRILKALSVLLAVVLLVTATPLSGFVGLDISDFDIFSVKAEAASSGKCGNDVKWKLDDEGTLTISGTGEMYDYNGVYSGDSARDADSAEWNNSRKKIKSIIIKSGVTSIGTCAFELCPNLTSVTIPNSVTSIGDDAFTDCTGLKSVTIPDGVTNINSCAFRYCTGLTSITIPDSVTSIEGGAFEDTGYYNNSSNWKMVFFI